MFQFFQGQFNQLIRARAFVCVRVSVCVCVLESWRWDTGITTSLKGTFITLPDQCLVHADPLQPRYHQEVSAGTC